VSRSLMWRSHPVRPPRTSDRTDWALGSLMESTTAPRCATTRRSHSRKARHFRLSPRRTT
jgi:hypothetical protein